MNIGSKLLTLFIEANFFWNMNGLEGTVVKFMKSYKNVMVWPLTLWERAKSSEEPVTLCDLMTILGYS